MVTGVEIHQVFGCIWDLDKAYDDGRASGEEGERERGESTGMLLQGTVEEGEEEEEEEEVGRETERQVPIDHQMNVELEGEQVDRGELGQDSGESQGAGQLWLFKQLFYGENANFCSIFCKLD